MKSNSASTAISGRHTGNRHDRRGSAIAVVILLILGFAVIGGVAFLFISRNKSEASINPVLTTVVRGSYVSQVLDQGEVQSSENVEIRCEVKSSMGQVSVLQVIPEGTVVSEGDFLIQLDASGLEKDRDTQRIQVTNAKTSVIQSQAALDTSIAAEDEYIRGLFVEQEKEYENSIFESDQNLKQAKATNDHSNKLAAKGFITEQTRRADEINVAKAENSLELAQQKLEVLRNITRPKELILLKSDIEASRVKLANDKESLTIEEQNLVEIEDQIERCRISVPDGVDGQVVYAKEFGRGGVEWILEEGASVRERQVLIQLPNPKKMEVKATVNEQSITLIRPRMPVSIKVDALTNQNLKGVVTKVNQYAEQNNRWSGSNVRKYAVYIRIIDPPEPLKPGMNASVSIQTEHQENALQLPVQAVYGSQDKQYCMVKRGTGWETVEIELGGDNSQVAWIKSGLEEGDQVVMNPGAYRKWLVLPEVEPDTAIQVPDNFEFESTEDGPSKQAEAESESPKSKGKRGKKGGQGGFDMASLEQRIDDSMAKYDTNSDGKIDATELEALDERVRGFVSQSDTDKDGSITRDEMLKSMKRMMERFRQGGGPGGGKGGPGGGDRGGR